MRQCRVAFLFMEDADYFVGDADWLLRRQSLLRLTPFRSAHRGAMTGYYKQKTMLIKGPFLCQREGNGVGM